MESEEYNVGKLLIETKNGNMRSFEKIIQCFQKAAFCQAFSFLGDRQLAEDIVQEAFIEAYRRLDSLSSPDAFPLWFRRIVRTCCNRKVRGRQMLFVAINDVDEALLVDDHSGKEMERDERDKSVCMALQALPDTLRMTAALYYIGGMSQKEIGNYLAISIIAVKKRVFNAKSKLKENIVNIAKTIENELPPAEQVSARIIAELVSRPQPLLIKGHPIRIVVEQIMAALPEYEMVESREVEKKEIYPSIMDAYYKNSDTYGYHLDSGTMLRTQTSGAVLRAIVARKPPVRLLVAGRVYRTDLEDDDHLKVFHQLDGICVSSEASLDEMKYTCQKIISVVLGTTELRYQDCEYGWIDNGMEIEARINGSWRSVIGCGMLKPSMLSEAGYDPKEVKGYGYGVGLERLAQLKLGLKTISELWRSPYVCS